MSNDLAMIAVTFETSKKVRNSRGKVAQRAHLVQGPASRRAFTWPPKASMGSHGVFTSLQTPHDILSVLKTLFESLKTPFERTQNIA